MDIGLALFSGRQASSEHDNPQMTQIGADRRPDALNRRNGLPKLSNRAAASALPGTASQPFWFFTTNIRGIRVIRGFTSWV
jgi:hypothetical protein